MDAWPRCLERLQAEFPAEDVHTWLKPLQADLREDGLVLYAPNAFVMEEVRGRYLERIRELLAHYAGNATVNLEIGASRKPVAVAPSVAATPAAGEPFHGNLDPHFTFDTFVEGRSNQFGRAAAWQAAQKPGDRAHNPLLLYGGTGLGKTHLMFAAGNEMRRQNPAVRVMYLRSEQFMNAFTKALYDKSSGGMEAFKRQFQGIDALLIDDIQFFAGKDRTREEFFHTFNALFDGRQQIILTCDRYPREVEGLEPRLKSRLGWGLSVAIDPPDFETRAQIVLAKARERGAAIPDDVAFLIAKKMRSNVRELEGAINKLTADARFTGRAITLEFAQKRCATCCARSSRRSAFPTSRKWWPTTTGCRSRICCPSAASLAGAPAPGRDGAGWGTDRTQPAGNRRRLRRPRPHHCAACLPAGPQPDPDRWQAARGLG